MALFMFIAGQRGLTRMAGTARLWRLQSASKRAVRRDERWTCSLLTHAPAIGKEPSRYASTDLLCSTNRTAGSSRLLTHGLAQHAAACAPGFVLRKAGLFFLQPKSNFLAKF